MDDADLEEAADLAATGSYKNSGQRCTAVKRILVHEAVADGFCRGLVAKTKALDLGDPMDEALDMGTLIDEAAAQVFEVRVVARCYGAACSSATSARARCIRRPCSTTCGPT